MLILKILYEDDILVITVWLSLHDPVYSCDYNLDTVSMMENCVPSPRVRSIRKKRMDHSGDIGSRLQNNHSEWFINIWLLCIYCWISIYHWTIFQCKADYRTLHSTYFTLFLSISLFCLPCLFFCLYFSVLSLFLSCPYFCLVSLSVLSFFCLVLFFFSVLFLFFCFVSFCFVSFCFVSLYLFCLFFLRWPWFVRPIQSISEGCFPYCFRVYYKG